MLEHRMHCTGIGFHFLANTSHIFHVYASHFSHMPFPKLLYCVPHPLLPKYCFLMISTVHSIVSDEEILSISWWWTASKKILLPFKSPW